MFYGPVSKILPLKRTGRDLKAVENKWGGGARGRRITKPEPGWRDRHLPDRGGKRWLEGLLARTLKSDQLRDSWAPKLCGPGQVTCPP